MTDSLEDHEGTVSIGGRTITNLRFADDINGLAGTEDELAKLAERLDEAYGRDQCPENQADDKKRSGINTEIKVS